MRRTILALIVLAALLGSVFVWDTAASPDASNGNWGRQRFAGTWIMEYRDPATGTLLAWELSCMNADGTIVSSKNVEYVAGFPAAGMQGNSYGSWKPTGWRTLRATAYEFLYDSNGTHTATYRATYDSTCDPTFQTSTANFDVEVLDPSSDPLDPNATVIYAFQGTGTARRISP